MDVFDKHWKEFSSAWKQARHGCSRKSVHKLRVSDRRLVAMLDLGLALQDSKSIRHLRKRFMKLQKSLGPLRDVQVELSEMREHESVKEIRSFRKFLKRAEEKEIRRVIAGLRAGKKEVLKSGVRRAHAKFQKAPMRGTATIAPHAVDQLIVERYRGFTEAWKNFDPDSDSSLHAMRIALKDFRYTLEGALEVFKGDAGKRTEATEATEKMKARQKMMGDLRDSQILAARLQHWSEKRGLPAGNPVRRILGDMKRRQRRLTASLVRSQPELLG